MKLPLITKLDCGTKFHVLQFEAGMAYGVDDKTNKVRKCHIEDLQALTEQEYAEHKASTGSGAAMIAAERTRQIESEGWTPEHDDSHVRNELGDAARCYITSAEAAQYDKNCVAFDGGYRVLEGVPGNWPWESDWWKPTDDPVKDLVKAGALVAAEIDRLKRIPGHNKYG